MPAQPVDADPDDPAGVHRQNIDLAFTWINRRTKVEPGKAPFINHDGGYTPKALSYAGFGLPEKVRIIGNGKECVAVNPPRHDLEQQFQRDGDFDTFKFRFPTRVAIPLVQVQGPDTWGEFLGRMGAFNLNKRFEVCGGDSGSPVLKGENVAAVVTAKMDWPIVDNQGRVENASLATAAILKPYQPWLTDQLEKFCAMRVGIRIANDTTIVSNTKMDVEGWAHTRVNKGAKIIDCAPHVAGREDCSQGLGETVTESGRENLLAGDEGDIIELRANSVPNQCFKKWSNAWG